ncbi:MAG TPA: FHA domain-containing protein [Pseudonocardia sp.]
MSLTYVAVVLVVGIVTALVARRYGWLGGLSGGTSGGMSGGMSGAGAGDWLREQIVGAGRRRGDDLVERLARCLAGETVALGASYAVPGFIGVVLPRGVYRAASATKPQLVVEIVNRYTELMADQARREGRRQEFLLPAGYTLRLVLACGPSERSVASFEPIGDVHAALGIPAPEVPAQRPELSNRPLVSTGAASPAGGRTSGFRAFGTQASDTQASGTGTQASGTQTSGTQASGTQASGTQTSGTQIDGAGVTGTTGTGTGINGTGISGTGVTGTGITRTADDDVQTSSVRTSGEPDHPDATVLRVPLRAIGVGFALTVDGAEVAQCRLSAGSPGVVVVGRGSHVGLRCPSALAEVSREHAELTFADGRVWVEDKHSANGTWLRLADGSAQRLVPGELTPLEADDAIWLDEARRALITQLNQPRSA